MVVSRTQLLHKPKMNTILQKKVGASRVYNLLSKQERPKTEQVWFLTWCLSKKDIKTEDNKRRK